MAERTRLTELSSEQIAERAAEFAAKAKAADTDACAEPPFIGWRSVMRGWQLRRRSRKDRRSGIRTARVGERGCGLPLGDGMWELFGSKVGLQSKDATGVHHSPRPIKH